jgi:Tfp pilus assembly protein PilV
VFGTLVVVALALLGVALLLTRVQAKEQLSQQQQQQQQQLIRQRDAAYASP